jgi:hypothetical protein
MTKRNVTAKTSPLPCIYYFAFSGDHIGFVAASLAFHQDQMGSLPPATIISAMGNRETSLFGEAKRDR